MYRAPEQELQKMRAQDKLIENVNNKIVTCEIIPTENLKITTIDGISSECGMLYDPREIGGLTWNGCRAVQNMAEGTCHTYSCPLAHEIDEEDYQWTKDMEGGNYMLQHSKFIDS